jgi:hypothetical protein
MHLYIHQFISFCCGLAVSDINVMLGKLRPELFPSVFGLNMDQPLDDKIVTQRFEAVAAQVNAAFPNSPPKDAYEVKFEIPLLPFSHTIIEKNCCLLFVVLFFNLHEKMKKIKCAST